MASTRPVDGSMTTTEPSRSPNASFATCCTSERRVNTTDPVGLPPPNRSPMAWRRCSEVVPASTLLWVFSIWVLP